MAGVRQSTLEPSDTPEDLRQLGSVHEGGRARPQQQADGRWTDADRDGLDGHEIPQHDAREPRPISETPVRGRQVGDADDLEPRGEDASNSRPGQSHGGRHAGEPRQDDAGSGAPDFAGSAAAAPAAQTAGQTGAATSTADTPASDSAAGGLE